MGCQTGFFVKITEEYVYLQHNGVVVIQINNTSTTVKHKKHKLIIDEENVTFRYTRCKGIYLSWTTPNTPTEYKNVVFTNGIYVGPTTLEITAYVLCSLLVVVVMCGDIIRHMDNSVAQSREITKVLKNMQRNSEPVTCPKGDLGQTGHIDPALNHHGVVGAEGSNGPYIFYHGIEPNNEFRQIDRMETVTGYTVTLTSDCDLKLSNKDFDIEHKTGLTCDHLYMDNMGLQGVRDGKKTGEYVYAFSKPVGLHLFDNGELSFVERDGGGKTVLIKAY